MATLTKPHEDLRERVNKELALGSDMEFQRKWWRFEKVVWWLLLLVVIGALPGVFGRGFLAKSKVAAGDGSIQVEYDRFARYSTPSILRVRFAPQSEGDGKVQLWVSDELMNGLGSQRVSPQPLQSVLDNGGVVYTFPAVGSPAMVQFALQPGSPGIHHLTLRVPGAGQMQMSMIVWP